MRILLIAYMLQRQQSGSFTVSRSHYSGSFSQRTEQTVDSSRRSQNALNKHSPKREEKEKEKESKRQKAEIPETLASFLRDDLQRFRLQLRLQLLAALASWMFLSLPSKRLCELLKTWKLEGKNLKAWKTADLRSQTTFPRNSLRQVATATLWHFFGYLFFSFFLYPTSGKPPRESTDGWLKAGKTTRNQLAKSHPSAVYDNDRQREQG